ncbi:hypothetical protein [Pseudonocardia spinosispora]|uniref:hypothetical protein n=1 Tax=Pseudonocardia spinosispora TaxID=103441 RepID=UPI00041BABEF|nr:hypothetical protein [Pseudonocardia spinosispora]
MTLLLAVPGSSPTGPVPAAPPPQALYTHDPRDIGDLADPARMAGCLELVGATGATVLDGRRIDQGGVQLVLPGDVPGRYRIVVVTEDCGPGTGRLLSDRDR